MKPSEIKVGRTYCNRGAGRTTRRVLFIGKPAFAKHSQTDVVIHTVCAKDVEYYDFSDLRTFAAWAGSEVNDE